MKVLNKIEGPQSNIVIFDDNGVKKVRKIATSRGNQDIVDQVDFYTSLPENIKKYFPKIESYQVEHEPYMMTYQYLEGITLRQLVIETGMNERLLKKLAETLKIIHDNLHTIITKKPEKKYVDELFFDRVNKRLEETRAYIRNDWFINDYYLDGKLIKSPIKRILKCLNEIKYDLEPEFICSTHGQLGPSHIIYNDNEFSLIDVKGFKSLYDPLYDICKIQKGLKYGTEWLEDRKYKIDFKINQEKDQLEIFDFLILDFDRVSMNRWFNKLNDQIFEDDYGKRANIRLLALVAADIVASLPFGYKTEGIKRVASLCVILDWIATDLEEEIANEK